MKQFKSFDAFTKHIEKIPLQYDEKELKTLIFLGIYLQNMMKDKIGHLQQGAGEFETWEPLAESTIADKKRLGYVYNDEYNPLLRTGELRDSIKYTASKNNLVLGSDDQNMVYQEMGTKNIPPRSVMGLTMFKEKKHIVGVLAKFIVLWISAKPIQKEILDDRSL